MPELVLEYWRRGWAVRRLDPRTKEVGKGTPIKHEDLISDVFVRSEVASVGVDLGDASGGVIDCDLDSPEAVAMADETLPETGAVFGRAGKRRSHRLYVVPGLRRKAFQDGDDMILELRGTGHGTVFPPSLHESGEPIAWDAFGEPTRLEGEDPLRPFRVLATKALVARRLPDSGRHDFARALAGFLLRGGRLDEDNALKIMEDAWDCAGYPHGKHRSDAMRDLQHIVEDTAKKIEDGKPVQGGPTLEGMSPGLPAKIAEWWTWDVSVERTEALLDEVREMGDAEAVWSNVNALAGLSTPDYERTKGRLKRLLGKDLDTNALTKAVNEARRRRKVERAYAKLDNLPVVQVDGRPLRDQATDALAALVEANEPPKVFARGGGLARVRRDENGLPVVDDMAEAHLRGRMTRTTNFVVMTAAGPTHVSPPKHVVQDVLALGEWPFPVLDGVTEAPVLRPDGTVLERPGYDPTTRLYYVPDPNLRVPEVPEDPTKKQVEGALSALDEAIGEFPYAGEADKANLLALLLTPVMRPVITGNVPMALLDAPQAGTGKSLLGSIIPQIATGRAAGVMTESRDEEEWRKRITAALAAGKTIITIDNVRGRLESAQLAAALTTAVWEDRLLGRSEMLRLPQRATWMATGNNIVLGGDLPRRCYQVRLDAGVARPWLREGFKHEDLPAWVAENRGELLGALLTVARAWFAAGQPKAKGIPALGNFDSWVRAVGGALSVAGVSGFLGNLAAMYEGAEDEANQWEAFLAAWSYCLGESAKPAKEIARMIRQEYPSAGYNLRESLPEDLIAKVYDNNFATTLGTAFSQRRDRRYGEYRLHRHPVSRGVAKWSVICEGGGPEKGRGRVVGGSRTDTTQRPRQDTYPDGVPPASSMGPDSPTPPTSPTTPDSDDADDEIFVVPRR